MLIKIYASRSQTRAMGLHDPIGDPYGGVAYGERNDPVTAAVVVGGGLVGGMMQGNAAQKAAQTQADANAQAQQQLLATGQQASQQFNPYTQLGQTGVNSLSSALPGLTNGPSTYQSMGGYQGPGNYQPIAGYQNFTNADLNAQLAPNYAFQLQQGQGATNAANNATGGMVGGNALKGLQDYTQNFAGNAYQNALANNINQYNTALNANQSQYNTGVQGSINQYNTALNSNMGQQAQAYNQQTGNQTNIFNRLASIAGIGLTGATNTANAQLGTGSNIAQLTQGIGQAQAAGQIGQANAYANGFNNLSNYALLSSLNNPQSGAISSTGTGQGASVGSGYVPNNSNYLGSDIRLKENIQLLGNLPNGLPYYSYEYKPKFKDDQHCGHGKFIGVMAHEVEKVIPTAVMVRNDGYKVVDYSQIRG